MSRRSQLLAGLMWGLSRLWPFRSQQKPVVTPDCYTMSWTSGAPVQTITVSSPGVVVSQVAVRDSKDLFLAQLAEQIDDEAMCDQEFREWARFALGRVPYQGPTGPEVYHAPPAAKRSLLDDFLG